MTKEELEKATGQELIEQRNYCGVDGYYGDCLNDVNAEMLKRFNRLVDLEKKNAEQKKRVGNLIVRLSACLDSYSSNIFEKALLKEAEQFLKEIEENDGNCKNKRNRQRDRN